MGREKKRGGRRGHLNDFSPTAGGGYVYTGAHYIYTEGPLTAKRAMGVRWVLSLGALACAVAGGCIPTPGMGNSFYVILPWLAALLFAASAVWAVGRMGSGARLRAYVYEKTVKALPIRSGMAAAFGTVTAVLTGVFLILNGVGESAVGFTVLFFILHGGVIVCSLGLVFFERKQEWKKQGD